MWVNSFTGAGGHVLNKAPQEMTAIPPTTEPAAPSAAAERMRRHRQRRRDGLRGIVPLDVEIGEAALLGLSR